MEVDKTTLVLGASLKPERYSNMAVNRLRELGIPTLARGLREGTISDVAVSKQFPKNNCIHTVTIYLGKRHQPEFYDRIIDLKPERVIFNPGAENDEFAELLLKEGIEPVEACTLVMLSIGNY